MYMYNSDEGRYYVKTSNDYVVMNDRYHFRTGLPAFAIIYLMWRTHFGLLDELRGSHKLKVMSCFIYVDVELKMIKKS